MRWANRDNRIALVQHRGGAYDERARSTFPTTSLGQTERKERLLDARGLLLRMAAHVLGAKIEDDA
jgi:hypothetical protein